LDNNALIILGVSLRVGLLRASLRLVLRCSPHWLTPPSASLTRFAIRTKISLFFYSKNSFFPTNNKIEQCWITTLGGIVKRITVKMLRQIKPERVK
jgi:hypothetical protein